MGISVQPAGFQGYPPVEILRKLFVRLFDAYIAHCVHQGLAVFSGKPVEELPCLRVFRLVLANGCVEGIDVGVSAFPDGLRGGVDIVRRHKAEIRTLVHVPGVVIDGIAQGVPGVGVAGHAVHQLAHLARPELAGGVHHGRSFHQELFHKGLGAGVLFPLEGDDLRILPAEILPVLNLSGVDVLQLGRSQ